MAGGITETGEPYSDYVSVMLSADDVASSVTIKVLMMLFFFKKKKLYIRN